MNNLSSDDPLLPGEAGLLTVAERRGAVRTPARMNDRNDVAAIERHTLLKGLVERGLMREMDVAGGSEKREFQITEEGRAALAAIDERHD